jgi:hypothetical protein
MKFCHRMLGSGVLLMAAMMAANELPELLTLTDNTANDYVSVRSQSKSQPPAAIKDAAGKLMAAPVVFNPPARLRVAADSNFLHSATARFPNRLLQLIATQRT